MQISSRLIRDICSLWMIQTPPFFESRGWSDLIKLYPSILILSSLLWIEEFRNVSDRRIISQLYRVTYAWRNKVWSLLLAVRPFKFQWKKVKNQYLGPRFTSISPHCMSKFEIQRERNIMVFTIFGSLVIKQIRFWRFLVNTRSKTCWALVRWSVMTFKRYKSETLIALVKTGDFLTFDLILGNDFKA